MNERSKKQAMKHSREVFVVGSVVLVEVLQVAREVFDRLKIKYVNVGLLRHVMVRVTLAIHNGNHRCSEEIGSRLIKKNKRSLNRSLN